MPHVGPVSGAVSDLSNSFREKAATLSPPFYPHDFCSVPVGRSRFIRRCHLIIILFCSRKDLVAGT
jgi:hypothetical protein